MFVSTSSHSTFLDAFSALRTATLESDPPSEKGGRPPRLSSDDIIAGLAWHVLQPSGNFSASLHMLMGVRMSDSSLSERRQSLGTKPWFEAMNLFLSKGNCKSEDPSNTYVGLRMVAVDGTSFSCGNTPAFKEEVEKTWTRRGRAAFFRIPCVALYDLCTHRPLAVQIGENADSESVLAAQIVHHLGKADLLIADRYYGNGKWVARLSSLPARPKFLIRVKENLGAKLIKKLEEGSRLVQVKDPDTGEMILVREIKSKLRRIGGRWIEVRFWTNLLDPVRCPAIELVGLYAMRWEPY